MNEPEIAPIPRPKLPGALVLVVLGVAASMALANEVAAFSDQNADLHIARHDQSERTAVPVVHAAATAFPANPRTAAPATRSPIPTSHLRERRATRVAPQRADAERDRGSPVGAGSSVTAVRPAVTPG